MTADVASDSLKESLFALLERTPFLDILPPPRPCEQVIVYRARRMKIRASLTKREDARIEQLPNSPKRIVLVELIFCAHELLKDVLGVIDGLEVVDERLDVRRDVGSVGTEDEVRELLKETMTSAEVESLLTVTAVAFHSLRHHRG